MPERSHSTTVSLGCGTLIIIAIIVAIFSQSETDDLRSEISSLRMTVEELKEAVESQTATIEELESKISELTLPVQVGESDEGLQ